MQLSVLGSGSTGNTTLVIAGRTHVLIDAGLSARETLRRLILLGKDPEKLNGVVITHEHGDHAGGLRVLLKSIKCPVYISAPTLQAYVSEKKHERRSGRFTISAQDSVEEPQRRVEILRSRTVEINSGEDFCIGEIDFHPFTVPHDAADNIGLVATHNGVRVATVMDFGHFTTLVRQSLLGCAIVAIESNHDSDMLKACEVYPWELKQRIMSRTGHISNRDVATWLSDTENGFDGQASDIILTHLSQRANHPDVARVSADR
ncbi:MAG: MBL fold metallo-hydrolase, partial [Pyrinomonadaceae bacterium]